MSERREQIKDVKEDHLKTCFIIMPIADPEGYAPGHFKRVYDFVIEPACTLAGFKARRADDVISANLIMIDVLESILNYDMAVCDLSARNPNVLYELGIRQSFDMPVTLIKDDVTREIFDIQGIRYLSYDSQLRIDLVGETVKALAASIISTYEDKEKNVSSLVQLLGRNKATVKDTNISSDALNVLNAIDDLRKIITTINLSTSSDVQNSNFLPLGTVLLSVDGKRQMRVGSTVTHKEYGQGIVAGLGSVKGTGVYLGNFLNFGVKPFGSADIVLEEIN